MHQQRGDQLADSFVEHTVRRGRALPWLMSPEQRRQVLPSPARTAAAAVLLVVIVVGLLWAALAHWAPAHRAPVTAAAVQACTLVVRDRPAPRVGGGPVVFNPTMLAAVARSGDPDLEREWRPMVVQHGAAGSSAALAAYHQLVATCDALPTSR